MIAAVAKQKAGFSVRGVMRLKKAQAAGDPDTGTTYYHHWLATLERMVAAKGLATPAALARTYQAWEHAAQRTPHGTPIDLRLEDFK